MKIFVDTANPEEIRQAAELGIVDGVTTNPSLIAKVGRPFQDVVKEIVKIVDGPISVEATGATAAEMAAEGEKYAAWSKNIVIKIPMNKEGMKAVKMLAKKGIRSNVTLVFSANQALLAAKAGAAYVSPFVGRLDDISENGMDLIRDIMEIYKNYDFKTEVIVASVRHPVHVIESAKAGAHVATIPFDVIEKMFKHPLTDAGIKKFLEDWAKVQK
jgi:transaldolase